MQVRRAAALAIVMLASWLAPAAGAAEQPFPIFYQGTESLVLRRLELDPSTIRVENLADARVAVLQGDLPASGAALDDLKARVESGMGLLIVTGPPIDAMSLKSLTNGAVDETGSVDVPM